ncbi:acyl-CoA Delta(11) desaturase [Pogonomyrmex barbatus]|uniref:Acyl-CoA Delta(11) desaturase n=1 Tax=Pogonomyrmex barbatus TaxID=144034 RepID=A0A6I9WZH9_9HYME|nr:acyl-CoA Delta(11) desaturase [Pogonomyrmex barbatus]XP_011637433.1 acyl-CoA Delta(11) desaturase [Pogonomyrmex barbatus]
MKKIKEETNINNSNNSNEMGKSKRFMKWTAVLLYIYLHVFGIVGLYFLFIKAKWMTVFYFVFLITISSIALTAGAHRLYAHQTFVATWQLRLFIMLTHTLAGVGSIYNWVFWHRVHHKYYGTDRDPYNHKKGFFYSHIISNLLSVPTDIKKYSKDIDMRDIESDGYVWTQRKFYWILFILFGFLLPINIAIEYWNESTINSFLIIGAARLMITTNISWLVNSALLIWGLKKGDKFPVDDNSVFFLSKSYWLNYHYLLPWDWKSDEFGTYETGFNTFIVKMWRELDFINEMKTATSDDVREALYKIATSKMTMKEALEEIKANSEEVAYKEKLIFRH